MKKTLLLIVTLLIIVSVLFILAIRPAQQLPQLFAPTPTPVLPPFSTGEAPTLAPTPVGDTITIDGTTIDNFYNTSSLVDPQGDRSLADTNDYRITFLQNGQQFLITINGDFAKNRAVAEQKLLELLNISKPTACSLNVVIRTTIAANPDLAGQDFSLSFCQTNTSPSPIPTQSGVQTQLKLVNYESSQSLDVIVGNPTDTGGDGGNIPIPSGSLGALVGAVNQILSCEGGGAHAPTPSCVNKLSIPQSFKNNLNATYPNFQCGQFIWSAQHLLGWPVFPGNVGSVFQWYSMNAGHKQNGYRFICNPYRIGGCTTSKTNQAGGAIAPGDIIIYGSTGRSDPGHIAIVVTSQSNEYTIRVTEANYRHGVTWFRWTNLSDNLGRGANILGWWRKL